MSSSIRENNCIQENKLRALLDSELSATESEAASKHLASCPACAAKLDTLRAEAAAVDSLFASLAPEQPLPTSAPALLPVPYRGNAARLGFTAALSLGALAAVIVAAILLSKRSSPPQAPTIGTQQPVHSAPAIAVQDHSLQPILPRVAKNHPVVHQTSYHQPNLKNFIPLDNDGPIESGFIYRVKLPGTIFTSLDPAVISSQVSADVIVDSTGRPRAIRFLGTQVKSSLQGE
jgi:hypothetical protein